jgi:hypothetical protein
MNIFDQLSLTPKKDSSFSPRIEEPVEKSQGPLKKSGSAAASDNTPRAPTNHNAATKNTQAGERRGIGEISKQGATAVTHK